MTVGWDFLFFFADPVRLIHCHLNLCTFMIGMSFCLLWLSFVSLFHYNHNAMIEYMTRKEENTRRHAVAGKGSTTGGCQAIVRSLLPP